MARVIRSAFWMRPASSGRWRARVSSRDRLPALISLAAAAASYSLLMLAILNRAPGSAGTRAVRSFQPVL